MPLEPWKPPSSGWARSAEPRDGESSARPRTKLFERLRSSAWTSLALRSAAFVAVLSILAAIGRFSLPPPAASAPVAVTPAIADAGDPAPSPPAVLAALAAVDAAPPPAASAAPAGHVRATPEDPVYLNHAGPEELRRLPGVGTKRADAILALRARLGRFQRVEELLRVKGVGRAMLRKWRPLVRLDTPARPENDAG